jgi:hypothetical protein
MNDGLFVCSIERVMTNVVRCGHLNDNARGFAHEISSIAADDQRARLALLRFGKMIEIGLYEILQVLIAREGFRGLSQAACARFLIGECLSRTNVNGVFDRFGVRHVFTCPTSTI